jgi:hypothetical protein
VHDAFFVRRRQTVGDLHGVVDRLAQRHRARRSRSRSVSPSSSSVTMYDTPPCVAIWLGRTEFGPKD